MKKFCKDLKEHATRIINYKKKKIIPLTNEERKTHRWQKRCYICKKEFSTDNDDKINYNVRDHCHYTGEYRDAAHNICNLKYKTPREIPVVFHNGSTYDYHLIIKELAKEFEGPFECLGENTVKYIAFSVPIKKQITKKDKDGNDKIVDIPYKIKFIDSYRFMSRPLSKLVDNLSEGLHTEKCADCKSYLDYMSIKDDKLIIRCFECKKNYEKKINEELIKIFANTYEFCNKEAFYRNLNMEDVTDVDYRHANKVFKEFRLKNLGEYHDLYVQSNTLLLADVFENFRNMCIKAYEPDPAHFLSTPGLAWQACLKKQH